MGTFDSQDIQEIGDDLQKSMAQFQEVLQSESLDSLWDDGVSLLITIEKKSAAFHSLVRHYHAEMRELTCSSGEIDVDALLDALGARFQEILDHRCEESVDEESFFASLGIEQFTIDEMLVAAMPVQQRTGEGKKQERNDHLVMQKLRLLVELLYEKGCRSKDLYVVHGKNPPESWRYRPYFLVSIPRFQRMVVMNAAYGAATFILPKLYGWKDICIRDGEQLQEELGAHRVTYTGETRPEGDAAWKEKVSLYLFGENTQTDIVDTKELSVQELYRYHIQMMVATPEAWMELKKKDKEKIKPYDKKGLFAIAGIFGVEGNPVSNSRVMAELGIQIYGEHPVFNEARAEDPTDSWTRVDWQRMLREQTPTPETWMDMNVKEKLHFKSYGKKGLCAIAGIFGVEGHPVSNSRVMAELGIQIYGEHPVFDEARVEVQIEDQTGCWTREDWQRKLIEQISTPEAWMAMNAKEKGNFKPYDKKGLYAIAGIFGVEGNPIGYSRVMAELGIQIYGEHPVFEEALAEDPTVSWTREDWQRKLREHVPTPEGWMGMTVKEKRDFKPYGGKGLRAIARIFGVEGNPVSRSRVMAELGLQIYGEHPVFRTVIED